MSDRWDKAASNIISKKQADQQAATEAARLKQIERKRKEAETQAAHNEMQKAIAEAVPKLAKFLAQRGASAQRLIAAYSDRAHIMFGCDQEGGYYSSHFLDGTGLRHENGTAGGYSSNPRENRAATPEEAIKAFAYYGEGRNDPKKVRNIVQWLTERIETYVPKD